ncbi:hypothetical protein CDL15_Pgr016645 [Punica granatum]|uniref:Rx N-terminal domain-containing protein n=2 Tax=Punica granatum TaxID=22663 RepID=A0A218XUX9_PUNGR|nr:hypothetical protein CDL15_Pgr016645 [Punica granatum]
MSGETRVTPWLDDLRDLAYDAEEAQRSSSMPSNKAGASSSKLLNLLLPSCCVSFLSP